MRFARATLVISLTLIPTLLHGQAYPSGSPGYGLELGDVPHGEVGLSYLYLHANAPPGQCGCFSLNGASLNAIVNVRERISLVADLAVAHADRINGTQQNITTIDYLFGPRYSRRTRSRFVPYGQILIGGAKEQVNFEFAINRNALGLSVGGGLAARLSRRIGLDLIQADYVYTRIPNGKNNTQNDTRISTGLTYRF